MERPEMGFVHETTVKYIEHLEYKNKELIKALDEIQTLANNELNKLLKK